MRKGTVSRNSMCAAIKLSTAMVVTDRLLDFSVSIMSAILLMPTTKITVYMASKVYLYRSGRTSVLLTVQFQVSLLKMEKNNAIQYVKVFSQLCIQ
ncbi:hypothetical protein AALO_G00012250 [Alosa alosa]|uniref:Uncharacterized protein n=1 Tax=Alosa alosa TaxID=278164 RepID=A0AAV6HL06_9TELE|nr:hypothetical protein AALO_G00012250 [Alosa alosa]